MKRLLIVAATAVAAGLFYAPTDAHAAPAACQRGVVDSNSPVIGVWSLRQRDDDTGEWAGPWDQEFRWDGAFAQGGAVVGRWCIIDGGTLLFGFDGEPFTTYRARVTPNVITGTESWDAGHTGEFEMRRR